MQSGPSPLYACRADPRFGYCLYVPPEQSARKPDLLIAVHGSLRLATMMRDTFSAFARWNHCVVLSPLFPVGVLGDSNDDGYKYLHEADLRYDQVLLAMVEEATARLDVHAEEFALFGYSGGGHFAHRFFTLHPKRLWAVSIGAPGSVTLLDESRDWWIGVRNIRDLFGVALDVEAMKRVPVQMIVGRVDLETFEIEHKPGERYWMTGANDAGRTRPERLETLRESYERRGIHVRFDLLPDVAHDVARCTKPAEDFLTDVLRERRDRVPAERAT